MSLAERVAHLFLQASRVASLNVRRATVSINVYLQPSKYPEVVNGRLVFTGEAEFAFAHGSSRSAPYTIEIDLARQVLASVQCPDPLHLALIRAAAEEQIKSLLSFKS